MGLPRIRASAGCLVGVAALLHALHLSVPGLDSDQAIVGLMGRHILSGEFPTFFWGEPYSGTAESFLAALFFWGFGASRYTLALAPALVSLAFLWAAWRLAREIFGDGTALLALALLAIPPVFLVLHGVLARGNYIENLFLGTLCLVLAVRLGATEPGSPRARRLALLLGGLAGVAWYMSFQSLPYLIAAAGYLLWRRGRRLVPLLPAMLAAFVVGSLPFWLHNLSGDFGSAGAVRQSWGRVPVLEGAHRLAGQLPVLLGARDFTYTYERLQVAAVPGLSPLAGAVCGAGVLLALIDGLVRRRHAGTGLLALFVAAVLVMVVFGGFSAGAGDPRYLLPLYSALPLLLARGIAIAWRWRAVAIGGLLVVLAANLAAHGSVLAAEVSRYPRYRGEDRQLLEYLRAQGHTRVYAPDYWLGYRLTFDAGEDVILATPFWRDQPRWASKFPPYTFQVKAEPRAAYVVSGRVDPLRATLDAAGVGYQATRIGRFTVLHGFRRPPGGRPVPSAGWRASEPAGALAFDRDPWTVWRGAALGIDLGRVVWVEQTVLLLAPAGPHPRGVVVEGSVDGRRWDRLAEVADVVPGFAWIGEHLALEEPRRVALTFAPAAVRHLRLLGQPAEVAELFVYERGLAEPSPRLREAVGAELAGRWPDALARFAEIALDDPDDEEPLRRAMIAGRELGLDGWRAIYEFLSRGRLTGRSESRLRFARRYWELAGHRQLAWQRLAGVLAERGDREGADAVRAAMMRHFAPSVPVAVDFGTLGRDARFLGYGLRPPSAAPGASVEITYYWQVSRGARPDRWWVFVHFHDGRAVRLTQDHPFPHHGREPGWEAGERVRESYRLAIPARLDPGVYRIRLGLWSPDSGRRWRVWRNGWPTATHVADVGALTLGPEPPEPPADTR